MGFRLVLSLSLFYEIDHDRFTTRWLALKILFAFLLCIIGGCFLLY